jgi:hypothetical protein
MLCECVTLNSAASPPHLSSLLPPKLINKNINPNITHTQPDRTMVNTAIKACCLAGAMDEAELLAQTLREYGALLY